MKHHLNVRLRGTWTRHRWDRATGQYLGSDEGPNAITTAGIEELLKLMAGLGGTVFSQANSLFKVYGTGGLGGAANASLSCRTGYPDHSTTAEVVWLFDDHTSATYQAEEVEMVNSSSSVVFTQKTATGWGTKPASENWTYQYTLTLSNFGDGDVKSAGLDNAGRIFTGDSGTGIWNTLTKLRVQNQARGSSANVNLDGGYPSRSGTTLTWQFTSDAGSHLISWWWCAILGDDLSTVLSETEEAFEAGSKASNLKRVYTFTFTLS